MHRGGGPPEQRSSSSSPGFLTQQTPEHPTPLGHRSAQDAWLQAWVSSEAPAHAAPPHEAGTAIVRVRLWVPPSQSAEHALQALHSPHVQSTGLLTVTQPRLSAFGSLGLQLVSVQLLPSSQKALSGVCTHRSLISSHESTVQEKPSLQFRGVPEQAPMPMTMPSQTSSTVQNFPSLQAVPKPAGDWVQRKPVPALQASVQHSTPLHWLHSFGSAASYTQLDTRVFGSLTHVGFTPQSPMVCGQSLFSQQTSESGSTQMRLDVPPLQHSQPSGQHRPSAAPAPGQ